jgi:glycosyltransferase involved in cell wall biosynthesis
VSANGAVRRALVCAPLLPEFDREGGSRRIFYLIDALREAGWAVSFVAENPYGDERYVRILQQHGVAVYRGFGPRTMDHLKFGRFDVAIFAFWYLAADQMMELRRLSPETKIFVDVIDLHWLRHTRRYFLQRVPGLEAPEGETSSSDFASDMVRELSAYAQADAVLTTSAEEADMIHDLLGKESHAFTVPSPENNVSSDVPFEDRNGILFVANFNHPPNLDAFTFFCDEILPKIDPDLLSEHQFSVVGHRPPQVLLDYAKASPHVQVVGWVPSVVPYLQHARVTVVPMRYGAGTKTKLLQALMVHTPTVTTTPGIEGLNLVPGRHVLLADDADSFARATERLLTDAELWGQLERNCSEHVEDRHSRGAVRDRLLEVLESRLDSPPAEAPAATVEPG